MLNIKYIQNTFLLILIILFLHSCENTDNKQTLKQIAITLISSYADGKGAPPTIRNYEDAGIIGVNTRNLGELNLFIRTLVAEDIDTEEELNAVIDALGVSLASDIFGPVITIHGANPLTLVQGSTYTDPVVTAIDGRDGEVTVYCAGEVDTNRVGTYIVTHSAVDEAGNLVTVQRVIHIVTAATPPTTPPATLFSISGNASGLVGTAVLQNNNGDNLSVSNGSFIFNTPLADTTNYGVTVLSPPAGQTCTLTNAIGTISGVNVIDIQLTCTPLTPPGFNINFILDEDDSYLTGINISFTIKNTVTNDTLVQNWIYPNITTPATQIQFSLPAQLQTGDNYNIELNHPVGVPYNCYFPFSTITSGTMGTSDITLVAACGNTL